MAAQIKPKINLIPQKGLETTTRGRVLLWVLTTFRVIVIATEIIVMAAFLSRFWLDAKNTDLTEEIEQKKDVLVASTEFENEFKQIQKRLEILSELTKSEKLITNSLKTVTSYLPPDIFLDSFSFSENKIALIGISPGEISVQQLIVNLQETENFEEVSLVSIDSETESADLLKFQILISIK